MFVLGAQGGVGAGCPQRCCILCPQRLSRPDCVKPLVTWAGPAADPALNRRVAWRPPEVPSNPGYPLAVAMLKYF